jgi:hypothetical protein
MHMLSRSAPLLLVSASVACLVMGVVSCSGDTVVRVDAGIAADRPSTRPLSTGGSSGGTSDTGSALGGTTGAVSSSATAGGGGGGQTRGGQTKTGGAGGTGGANGTRTSSSARDGGLGGRSLDAGSAQAGSTSRVVIIDAPVVPDTSPGGEVGALACSDKTSNDRLGVYYYTGSSAAQTQDVQIHLDLINFTAETAPLKQATVRYWFTDEGAGTPNILSIYYSPPGLGKVNTRFLPVTPPRTGADTVLEISFTPAADAGVTFVETTEFNFAFHKDGYSGTYDQSNDYSFDGSLSKTLAANPKITAYIAGELAWGCEPPLAVSSQPDAGEQQ